MQVLKKNIFIIAEAGVNHNGSLSRAFKMVSVAKESGADAIKFQTSVPELVMTSYVAKANYQLDTTDKNETLLEMTKKIHLPLEAYEKLKVECEKNDIEFMSSPFDFTSLNTLKKLNIKRFKIPSGEITNLPYLRSIGQMNKPVIMSTGMAKLEEVRVAMNILIKGGTKKDKITILHCHTEYPTLMEDVNLRAMITMKDELEVAVGYSDHTLGIEIPIAAATLGAVAIEKHFTLDRNLPGPDHKSSLEPNELKKMIKAIRNIEKAMGDGTKQPSLSETKNMLIIRKSIVAIKPIKKGELFNADNITVKRPGTGISPMEWDNVIGKVAHKDYEPDDLIK